jgi:hypothetical protein
MNKISVKFLLCIVLAMLGLSSSLFGQQGLGQLNGSIVDPNGAVVPGAAVKITNTATGAERSTTTSTDGFYQFTSLAPGEYRITVTSSFKEYKTTAQVTTGGARTIDIKLGLQEAVNVVDVAAGAGGIAEVNTTDQQQSAVINSRQINNLPIIDRNPYSLAGLSGNVSGNNTEGRGAGVAINGLRDASTDVLLDGTENAAVFTAGIAQTVPQDSVNEFRIITNNFSAEYGRASGGIVDVVTKSGGNKFFASVFEQNRNSHFASNSFNENANGIGKGKFNRNQFGGTASGAIIKNKLFFFESLEGTMVRSSSTTLVYVPTASFIAAMAPNAQAIFSANTLSATPTGTVVAVAGAPAQCIVGGNNVCTYQLVRYTAPIDAGGGTPTNDWNNVARVDWNISDKTTANFSYKLFDSKNRKGSGFTSPYQGYDSASTARAQNFQGSFVHNFSSNFIIDLKVAYLLLQGGFATGGKPAASPTLYALSTGTASLNGQLLAYPGYIPYNPGTGLGITENEKLWDVKPNATWIYGDHSVRFGGQYVHIEDPVNFPAYQGATENLSNSVANASAALMGGTNGCLAGQACTSLFQVAVAPQNQFPGGTITLPVGGPNFTRTNLYSEGAVYANDSWRVVKGFTLNLGIRWEYYGPQKSKEQLDSNFFFGSGANIYQQIRNGRLRTTGTSGIWKASPNNWAPRIGFAWDITGDGKTSLRGGYGMAYERNFGNVTFNVIQNPPFYAVLGTNSTAAAPILVSNNNFGPLSGAGGTRILPRVTLRAVDPNIKQARAHQWGISLEREVARNTVFKLEYSGSAGRDLYSISNINRNAGGTVKLGSNAVSGTDCPATLTSTNRLNCNYGNINFRGSDGTSNYYGFTTSLESTNLFHSGLALTARYTYSKSQDDLSSTFSGGPAGNFNLGYLDPFNPMLDYGPSEFDIRHRFVASAIYPIPFKTGNQVADAMFNGWVLSTIVTVQSGSPFSMFDCSNAFSVCMRMQSSGNTLRFNGTSVLAGPNTYTFIDLNGVTPSTFTDAGGFTDFGPFPADMTKRGSFRAPGTWNADVSLFKNINITERYKVQIRADVFNVFNHANLFVNGASTEVNNTVDAAGNRGVVAFKDGNRRIQFLARFTF